MVLISYCSMFMYVKDKCWIHLCDVFMLFVCLFVCLFGWLVLFCFVSFVCSLFDFIGCDYKRHFKMVCSQATMVSTPHLMAILMGKLLFASMGIWVCHIGTKR